MNEEIISCLWCFGVGQSTQKNRIKVGLNLIKSIDKVRIKKIVKFCE